MPLDVERDRRKTGLKPLALKKLNAFELQIRRKLCVTSQLPSVTLGERTVTITIVHPPLPRQNGIVVRANVNGHLVAVRLDWSLIRHATGDALELVGESDAALLLEDHLAGWFDAFEQATGLSIRLDAICEVGKLSAITPIGLKFESNGFEVVVEMWANSDAIDALAGAMVPRPEASVDNVAIGLACCLFEKGMPRKTLSQLQVGAGLFLGPQSDTARLIVENQLFAPVERKGSSLTLQAELTPIPPLGDRLMSENPDADKSVKYDDIEIRIQIRAGEALITLADLRKLVPGSVISLPGYDGGAVDLLVNDQRIGRGALVEVPGGRAVEITELFSNG